MDGDDGGTPEETLSENLDRRLRVSAPSSQVAPMMRQQQQQQQEQQSHVLPGQTSTTPNATNLNSSDTPVQKADEKKVDSAENDDDSDLDEFDDDDQALEAFRQRRLAELQREHAKVSQQTAKGHGEVRTITQDEFLPECTGSSKFVVVHFFHDDFERCKLMDHHLRIIAPLHLSCKFIRINAEKAPFFVAKLAIQTLPTLIVFKDGKAIDRLMGFEGLSDTKHPDEFPTGRLGRWLEKTGAIEYEGPDSDDEEANGSRNRAGMLASRYQVYDEDI